MTAADDAIQLREIAGALDKRSAALPDTWWWNRIGELRAIADRLEAQPRTVEIAADVAQELVELLTPIRWVPEEVRMPPGFMQRWHLPAQASPAWNLVLEAHAPGDGASMLLRLATIDGAPVWQTVLRWSEPSEADVRWMQGP